MNQKQARILVAEDDVAYARQLSEILESEGYRVTQVHDGSGALKAIREQDIDFGFVDLAMPGVDGIQVLETCQKEAPEVLLVMLTGYATIERAVKATRLGAYDFIEKPVSLDRILLTVERALEKRRLQQQSKWMAYEILERYQMIGTSPPMQEIYSQIDRIAPADCAVLVSGETGTGKELVAMALHLQSRRSGGPFVKLNCAALPDTLIESELFGHKKGAFTGAIQDKKGRFLLAHRGSLFLDEVGDLSPSAQAKMLRVLQSHEFEPIGENRTFQVDVRIIAATNQSLTELIETKHFREDLYYRLSTVEIQLPPLRARKEDIPLLVDHFLEIFCQQNNRYIEQMEPQAMQLLLQQEWPGNVRQLRATVERLVIFAQGKKITVDDVLLILNARNFHQEPALTYSEAKLAFQKEFFTQALIAHDWNISATAQTLKINRTNLHKKMLQLGIERLATP